MGEDKFAEGKQTSQPEVKETVLNQIKAFTNQPVLQNAFDATISEIIDEVQSVLSEELEIEYHVVIFHDNDKKRYTILETKGRQGQRKQEDTKEFNFGVVGWLFNTTFYTEFIMAQAKFSRLPSHIYKLNFKNKSIDEVSINERNALIGDNQENDFRWPDTEQPSSGNGVRRTYAIAAMPIKRGGESIGALSFDFVRYSKEYPNYAFRKADILFIFQKMKSIIRIIERTLDKDFHDNFCSLVEIARGGCNSGDKG